MKSPFILHIDAGRTFRGGQRQLLLLSDRLYRMGIPQMVATPPGSSLRTRLDGVPVVDISPSAVLRVVQISRLKNMIRAHGINIVHAHDSHSHTLGIFLKRWKPDLKLIVTRRVIFPPSGSASRKYKYRRGVDRFFAISDAVKSSLVEAGIDAGVIEIIPSGLDLETIREAAANTKFVSSLLPGCTRIIALAGALTREKDVATAVRAVSLLAGDLPGAGMIVFGEGPERRRLERLARRLNANNIVFAGHHEPLAPVFKACHLFLLTSISEGLNTSAIEAAACGLPLVVSGIGGLPEIAEHEYNGLLCPPGDAGRFAAAMKEILEDDSRRELMASRSRGKAAGYDIDVTAKKTVEAYKRVLAG